MDMDTIIADWKQNAEKNGERNLMFLRRLKMKDDRVVDRKAHRLHEEAFSIIDCTQCAPRLSFEQKERLYSNLLPVKRLPKTMTFAKTRRSSFQRVKEAVEGYTPPFCIHGRFLYMLSDLRHDQNVLRDFCDVDTIDDLSTSTWMDDDESRRNLVFMFNQLLGSHCYRCGLAYNPDVGRTYFPRETENDEDDQFQRTWTSPRTKRSDNRTVVQRYEYGTFTFWRHLAIELSFVECGGKWFLQVTPKYFFTDDGKTPCNPELAGPYTTCLKAMEHNPQVLNHVLFWGHTLADGHNRICNHRVD